MVGTVFNAKDKQLDQSLNKKVVKDAPTLSNVVVKRLSIKIKITIHKALPN